MAVFFLFQFLFSRVIRIPFCRGEKKLVFWIFINFEDTF